MKAGGGNEAIKHTEKALLQEEEGDVLCLGSAVPVFCLHAAAVPLAHPSRGAHSHIFDRVFAGVVGVFRGGLMFLLVV